MSGCSPPSPAGFGASALRRFDKLSDRKLSDRKLSDRRRLRYQGRQRSKNRQKAEARRQKGPARPPTPLPCGHLPY
jgi:hypothetical protein